MKKAISFVVLMIIILLATGLVASASEPQYTAEEYASGFTEYDLKAFNSYIEIFTAKGAAQWSAKQELYLGKDVYLMNNIDVGGFYWEPIGNEKTQFQKTFDGNGHSIYNLQIMISDSSLRGQGLTNIAIGLFGMVGEFGVVQNLFLPSGSISLQQVENYNSGIYWYAGSIAGISYGLIRNCGNAAVVTLSRNSLAEQDSSSTIRYQLVGLV